MFHLSKGKSKAKGKSSGSGLCQVCSVSNLIYLVLSVIILIVALMGAYYAHVLPQGLTFGTVEGSLSLVALLLALFFSKKMCEYCPCRCEK